MEIRALECFIAVADAGTVTAGAAELGVGQPAVSRQIQQLERLLRVELFRREDGRLRLTSAGRDLLDVSRAALAHVDQVTATARALAAGRLERVRLAATGTTCDDVLAPWLATWGEGAPMPSIVERSVDAIYPSLRAGEAGADLVVAPSPPPPTVASRVVADLPVWAYVPRRHPWASSGRVDLADLLSAPLLLLDRTFHARRRFDAALERSGAWVEPVAEFSSPVVVQAVAASGRGVAVLTDDPRFDLTPLSIVDGAGRRLEIRLHAAWEPRHHAAPVLAALADDLAAFVADRYA